MDFQGNDELWNAMQPALRLVSRVLQSEPLFWRELFNLYNRRPVDHRLVVEKLEEGTSLTSIWFDIDESKMYPEARELRRLMFDAVGATRHVLEKLLTLGFQSFESLAEGMSGGTSIERVRNLNTDCIYLRIAPEIVWPLLTPQYSAAEKTAVSMNIASAILHELCVRYIFSSPVLRLLAHQSDLLNNL